MKQLIPIKFGKEPVMLIPYSRISMIELTLFKNVQCSADDEVCIVPIAGNEQMAFHFLKSQLPKIDEFLKKVEGI